MNVNIEEMITLNYELEGLLYFAMHRGGETPEQVWNLISAKIDALHDGLSQNKYNTPVSESSNITCDYELADKETESTESQPEKMVEDNESDSLEPLPEPEIGDFNTLMPDEKMTLIKEEEIETVESEPMDEPVLTEPIRLDEKLARENSRNLKKAFSLNDKFRFRRELFSNSDIEMTETLDAVQTMASLDEALDYFYNHLNWDRSNLDVKDFIEIITHHFSGK